MSLFIVHHVGPTGEKLTAHRTLPHARQSAQKRQGKHYRAMDGSTIYEVKPEDLHVVETHGKVDIHVEGQGCLF